MTSVWNRSTPIGAHARINCTSNVPLLVSNRATNVSGATGSAGGGAGAAAGFCSGGGGAFSLQAAVSASAANVDAIRNPERGIMGEESGETANLTGPAGAIIRDAARWS